MGISMTNQKVVKDIICIIERDHPVISRKSCVIDILLWEARRQGKEEELWRIFRSYSQSMDVDELDKAKAIEEIAKLLGVKVVYKYLSLEG
jgi:hypothetical protein